MSQTTKALDLADIGGPFGGTIAPLRHEQEPEVTSEPDPVSVVSHDGWPDPPTPDAFVGLAGELVETLDPHTEADRVAVLVQFLVAFGNAASRAAHFRVESDRHFLNDNAVLVGATAKGRKGTSWGHVRRLFSHADLEWEERRISSGLSSGEGLIWAVRDPIETQQPIRENRRVVGYEPVQTDAGVSDKRLLVVESEFSSPLRVMAREGNTLSAAIRQAWDTGSLRTLTKNCPATATDAHISIIGHITREELRRHLTETDMANGFANRFLWVCSRRSKMLPEGGAVEDSALFDLGQRIAQALDSARRLGRLSRTPEACELWRVLYPALSEGGTGLLGAVTSRAEAHVVRLSALYAALDGSASVEVRHLGAALALWRYCADSCRYIFGESLGITTADAILTSLRLRPAGMTRTEIRDLFHRHKKHAEVDKALADLQKRALACRRDEPTGGRSVERWFQVPYVASVASVAPSERHTGRSPNQAGSRDNSDISDESRHGDRP